MISQHCDEEHENVKIVSFSKADDPCTSDKRTSWISPVSVAYIRDVLPRLSLVLTSALFTNNIPIRCLCILSHSLSTRWSHTTINGVMPVLNEQLTLIPPSISILARLNFFWLIALNSLPSNCLLVYSSVKFTALLLTERILVCPDPWQNSTTEP